MPEPKHLIFVNYRGSDEIWATEYVYARMAEAFGSDAVFKAGNALRPGDKFSPILQEKAAHCPVMLVCVGQEWLDARDASGARRLDSSDDWVREEIRLALRAGNRVVPLLFGNPGELATPREADLPEDIRDLFGRQARRIVPGGGLDLTVPALVEDLAALVPELGARWAERRKNAAAHEAEQASQSGQSSQTATPAAGSAPGSVIFHIGHLAGDAVAHDKNVYHQPGAAGS